MSKTPCFVIVLCCIANNVGNENKDHDGGNDSAKILQMLRELQNKEHHKSQRVNQSSIGMSKRATVSKAYRLMEHDAKRRADKVKVKQKRQEGTKTNKDIDFDVECDDYTQYYYSYSIDYTYMLGCGCLSPLSYCDGIVDCQNEADEDVALCQEIDCPTGYVKCEKGAREQACISLVWLCDDYADCGHGHSSWDENPSVCKDKCKGTDPDTDVAQCSNSNQCIRRSWFCDGDDDCGDGSDETDYACGSQPCETGEVRCQTGYPVCIPTGFICDDFDDCIGPDVDSPTWDESNCDGYTCSADEFSCDGDNAYYSCIPESFVCDNFNDCGDGSDEVASLPGCEYRMCGYFEFPCATTNICIPLSWLCDDYDDCGDNSDELLTDCVTDGGMQCFRSLSDLTTTSRHASDIRVELGRQADLLKSFAQSKKMTSQDVRQIFGDKIGSISHLGNN